MSKAEGKIIGIKFSLPLVGDVTGNEDAFIITGQEYEYTDGPDHNGKLVSKTYTVGTVQTHPTEPNSIQLLMNDYIRNLQGNITLNYNQASGNLAGTSGAMKSFEEDFTPADLTQGLTATGGAYGTHEYIEANVFGNIDLIYIEKLSVFNTEFISASVGGIIQLIHVDDINP